MPTVRFGDCASELQENETALDALIPFDPGYMMVMWGRKRAS